jgi:hypothetical protein
MCDDNYWVKLKFLSVFAPVVSERCERQCNTRSTPHHVRENEGGTCRSCHCQGLFSPADFGEARRGCPAAGSFQLVVYQDEAVRPIRDPATGKWRYKEPDFTISHALILGGQVQTMECMV